MRKQSKTLIAESQTGIGSRAIPDVPAAALLGFIKQVSAEPFWDAKRLTDIVKVKPGDVPRIAAMLEMLGYAEAVPGKKDVWRNTQSGNTVSGAKPPRFNRENVLDALQELRKRAEQMTAGPATPFRVSELIAFGDFLDEHPKVQAADVGVALSPNESNSAAATAMEHKREEHVLADLKAKSPMLHLRLFEDWMRKRSHQDLLRSAGTVL